MASSFILRNAQMPPSPSLGRGQRERDRRTEGQDDQEENEYQKPSRPKKF
jgi:hypothetical protein